MRQTGTDYQRIRELFYDCFETGYMLGRQGAGETHARRQREFTAPAKVMDLCAFLDIELEAGEIISIAGKKVA